MNVQNWMKYMNVQIQVPQLIQLQQTKEIYTKIHYNQTVERQ